MTRLPVGLVLAALLACGGHTVETREIRWTDGHPAYFILCEKDPGLCYEEAADLCEHGYYPLPPLHYDPMGRATQHRHEAQLIIRCKWPPGESPYQRPQ